MWDSLFPAEFEASANAMLYRQPEAPPEPGTWQNFGSALVDMVPSAIHSTLAAVSGVIETASGPMAYANAGTIAYMQGKAPPDEKTLRAETIGKMWNTGEAVDFFRSQAKSYTPDPMSVGMAGQIVHGIGTALFKAGAYGMTTGPAAPFAFGADLGIGRTQELREQGADLGTAALGGLTTGVASAVGMRIPAAMGASRLQSAAIGAAINPAMNVAEVAGIRAILNHADYDKIAAQYDPFDPTSLAIAAVTGGVFGGAFWRSRSQASGDKAKSPETRTLTPDEHAAALVMNDVMTRADDTLTAKGDTPAANAGADAQVMARAQLESGEMVSVAHDVPVDAETVAARQTDVAQRINTYESRASLEQLHDDVLRQAREAGRGDEEAAQFARLFADRVETRAARLGVDPMELYRQDYPHGVEIRRGEAGPGDYSQDGFTPTEAAMARWRESLAKTPLDNPSARARLQTPTALRAMGERAGNLEASASMFQTVMKEHPDVPVSVFENLPALMADPDFVYRHREGGLTVVTSARTEDGRPVVVGVRDGRVRTVTPNAWEQVAADFEQESRRSEKAYARNDEARSALRAEGASAGGDYRVTTVGRIGSPSKANIITRQRLVNRHGDDFYQAPFDGPETATTPLPEGATHIDVDGVQRPALNSNGKPIHWSEEGTRNFWRWFGDSKVVDAEGRPLVLYHGTAAYFDAFDNSKTGANDLGLWGRGHYFASSPVSSNSYALRQGDGAMVMPTYLSIQNPLVLRTGSDLVTRLPDGTNTRELIGQNLDGSKIKAIALDGGHDGVIQIKPDGLIGDVVSFDPTQIKSATGNRGTFDPADPNILHQSAWHGSPYRGIEKEGFKLHAIGTGEGAQAYGWGIYFAGNRGVAEGYRKELSGGFRVDGRPILVSGARPKSPVTGDAYIDWLLVKHKGDIDAAIAETRDIYTIGKLEALRYRVSKDSGQLYSADIPENNELLDYDKRLSEQPEHIKDALDMKVVKTAIGYGIEVKIRRPEFYYSGRQAEGNIILADKYINEEKANSALKRMTGRKLYEILSDKYKPKKASELLNSIGIPGLRYLDGNSRRAGEGSHNYVIWDDSRLNKDIQTYYQKARASISLREHQAIISLFETANSSSLIHESGHMWLEELRRDAGRDGAPQQLRDDLAIVHEWLGVKEGEALTRKQHEQFARGFETYAMEGKAPSNSLARVFESFKQWLTDIYHSVTRLDSPINDDVRGMFDRLLATDEAIAKFRQQDTGLGVGVMKNATRPITVREGMAYIGEHQAINPDTGEHVSITPGATREDIANALQDAGAISHSEWIYRTAEAQTPEQKRAFDMVAKAPDAEVAFTDDNGNTTIRRVSDLLDEVAETETTAQKETAAFEAAIACAMRFTGG